MCMEVLDYLEYINLYGPWAGYFNIILPIYFT